MGDFPEDFAAEIMLFMGPMTRIMYFNAFLDIDAYSFTLPNLLICLSQANLRHKQKIVISYMDPKFDGSKYRVSNHSEF